VTYPLSPDTQDMVRDIKTLLKERDGAPWTTREILRLAADLLLQTLGEEEA